MSGKNVSLLNKMAQPPKCVCHLEAIRQELVIQLFNFFLQCDMCYFTTVCFFDRSFFSTPRSWVPIINTESLLFGQSVGHVIVEVAPLARCRVFSGRCIVERCVDTLYVDSVTPQSGHEVCFHSRWWVRCVVVGSVVPVWSVVVESLCCRVRGLSFVELA